MTTTAQPFRPTSSVQALLDQLYDVKFSKHTPLVVVLLSMVYTVYRTRHYLGAAFDLGAWVAWPTAIFIELLVLAASASMFIALRGAYVAELKEIDAARSRWGVVLAFVVLVIAFLALLFVAGADAYTLTGGKLIPTLIMSLIQVAQMILVLGFVVAADLDEREQLRLQYASWRAGTCPHCQQPVSPNNRARHINSCPSRI